MSSRNKKKSNNSRKGGSKTPSPTAQILEHVELLVALSEEQNESGAAVDGITQKLESQILKRFDSLEDQIAKSDSISTNDDSDVETSNLNSIIERFDSIESKLTAIEEKTQKSDGPQPSASKIQQRFEALDNRLDKITAAIEGQQKLIEATQSPDSSDIAALENQFSEMLSRMKNEIASIVANDPGSDASVQAEDEPNWSQQKQAMLSKYGIDPKHRPDMMAPPTELDPVLETTKADPELSVAPELDLEEQVSEDPEEIKKIKEELQAKLRDAEVELSIERAKFSQLSAELESKRVELDRRDSELTEKFTQRKNNSNSGQEQDGLLDRLKKHLTAKDRKNLDRI